MLQDRWSNLCQQVNSSISLVIYIYSISWWQTDLEDRRSNLRQKVKSSISLVFSGLSLALSLSSSFSLSPFLPLSLSLLSLSLSPSLSISHFLSLSLILSLPLWFSRTLSAFLTLVLSVSLSLTHTVGIFCVSSSISSSSLHFRWCAELQHIHLQAQRWVKAHVCFNSVALSTESAYGRRWKQPFSSASARSCA